MNQIKNKLRNRLGEYHLDMLMRVKSYQLHGNSINLDTVYKEWMNSKDRREKNEIETTAKQKKNSIVIYTDKS